MPGAHFPTQPDLGAGSHSLSECLVFEAPSGFEDKSRSSSRPSCSHLRKVQKSSEEEFGSLNLSLPSLLLKMMMVLFVLKIDSAGLLVQRGTQQTGQVSTEPCPSPGVPSCVDFRIAVQQNLLCS